MPFKNAADHALGDITQKYCSHCTDAKGKLLPYEEILKGTANYLVRSQGIAMQSALDMAKNLLSKSLLTNF